MGNDHTPEHYYLAEIAAGLARLCRPGEKYSRDEFLIEFEIKEQQDEPTEEQIAADQAASKSFWDGFLFGGSPAG